MKNSQLTVAMNGTVVGTLYRNGKGAMSWQYAQTWLQTPGARVISQSLPLTPRRQDGEAVYNFFSNLLPDSQAIIARMQTRFKVPTDHPFDLLASVGRDCVGAIQLYPDDIAMPPVTQMHATPLTDEDIAKLLEGYRNAPLGMSDDQDFRILGAKGISAQKAKMAMALQGKNRQYHWAQIQPRHFPATAERVGFSAARARAMMTEMGRLTPEVIDNVSRLLPADFPSHISEAIFRGMEKQAERVLRAE